MTRQTSREARVKTAHAQNHSAGRPVRRAPLGARWDCCSGSDLHDGGLQGRTGLRTHRHSSLRATYSPSLPRLGISPVLRDGFRFCSPLRGSSGFSPGSLDRRARPYVGFTQPGNHKRFCARSVPRRSGGSSEQNEACSQRQQRNGQPTTTAARVSNRRRHTAPIGARHAAVAVARRETGVAHVILFRGHVRASHAGRTVGNRGIEGGLGERRRRHQHEHEDETSHRKASLPENRQPTRQPWIVDRTSGRRAV